MSQEALAAAGMETVQDLLDCFPVSYRDYTSPRTLSEADSEPHLYKAVLRRPPRGNWVRGGLHILSLDVADEDGSTWASVRIFNQPYLAAAIQAADCIYLDGTARQVEGRLTFSAPAVLTKLPAEGIVPVYRRLPGLSPARHRRAVKAALSMLASDDPYSSFFQERYRLLSRGQAYRAVHAPRTMAEQELGRYRFAFESGLVSTRMLDLAGAEQTAENTRIIAAGSRIHDFEQSLPFTLTGAQKKVIAEIAADLEGTCMMNRLVEGDVGSGKTVAAFFAMYAAAADGFQSYLLAPTEVLASQHAASARRLLGSDKVVLVTGSMSAAERTAAARRIRSGEAPYIIGTHALLHGEERPPRPALLVTDEQHRFGVRQRRTLLGDNGEMHALSLSATPIPRSLALAVGGMSRISVLDELPPGRLSVETRMVGRNKISDMYAFMAEHARSGEQAFIVCPLVESADGSSLHSAEQVYTELCSRFPDVRFGLLHGRMPAAEKQSAMEEFRTGRTAVLVATTVVEVGVDVPAATLMIIHDADRFGLAQLHQLRGRVGRGQSRAWCFLTSASAQARSRLSVLCRTQNGFEIAEADMQERGAGEVLGLRQHGRGPDVVDIRDTAMLAAYREILDEMAADPRLRSDYIYTAERAAERLDGQRRDVGFN